MKSRWSPFYHVAVKFYYIYAQMCTYKLICIYYVFTYIYACVYTYIYKLLVKKCKSHYFISLLNTPMSENKIQFPYHSFKSPSWSGPCVSGDFHFPPLSSLTVLQPPWLSFCPLNTSSSFCLWPLQRLDPLPTALFPTRYLCPATYSPFKSLLKSLLFS